MIHLVIGIHFLLCLALIGLVLLQQGKGASMGATFGGANSQTVFGAAGAGNVLTKITTGIAIAFMCTSLILVRYYSAVSETAAVATVDPLEGSVMQRQAAAPESASVEVPSAPAADKAAAGAVAPAPQAAQVPAK
ncbi:MAG: preprotein translocase subunit SecG [Oligoflexia bacterium]|nr:preprotein translocase subunit SecG [Oligoflexia bacterium]